MLDNGYSLAQFEILNWGNFHGYQRFNLRPRNNDLGPLFAPPSASVILGINGSGKSTLIDALMITLLPFEGSVKLGVTNDVESGSAGGRTIRDYVLGKHSSTAGRDGGTLAGSMGRKDGCSMVLLSFRHNRNSDKIITIGRVWWYQNYVVSETQLAFLAYDTLSIEELCPDGKTPRAPKFFRSHCKERLPHVQVFDTMQAYFAALSSSLGKISRDDLRILNRAFYVKSISQIDQFIRENMLLEQANPHLERLLENVRNGKEIALAIETCERKIASIERILKDLRKLEEGAERKIALERHEMLLRLHKEWEEVTRSRAEIEKNRTQRFANETELPQVTRSIEDARRQHAAVQSLIIHNDVDARLQKLAVETEYLAEQIRHRQSRHDSLIEKAHPLGLQFPKRPKDWLEFEPLIDKQITEINERSAVSAEELERLREEKYTIDAEAKSIRDELQHLTANKTMIPRDLHSIKMDAIEQLRIPPSHLHFVGELIQVPRIQAEYRKAIESVLLPISRNLLVHPDHLDALTKWLNAKGLRSDLVAKRILNEELNSEDGQWEGSARRLARLNPRRGVSERRSPPAEDESYVLDKIEILPEDQHPFTAYLWQWLRAKFDFKIVDLKEFKSTDDQLVTIEGLVKSDRRTMRKPKQAFSYSLGWDNSERVGELAEALRQLNDQNNLAAEALRASEEELRRNEDRRRLLEEVRGECREFAHLDSARHRLETLRKEHDALLKGNPDYRKLKEQEAELTRGLQELQKRQSLLEAEIEACSKRITTLETLLPRLERELKESLLFARLRDAYGGESPLDDALALVDTDLAKRKMSRLQLEAQLRTDLENLEKVAEKSRSAASSNLNGYRRDFNDPNVPYEVPTSQAMAAFVAEWAAAEARLRKTELPNAQEKWRRFFDQVLMESVKDTINEIKAKIFDTERSIQSINDVLKLTNFEDLPDDQRYLKIDLETSSDERIRRFRRSIDDLGKILGPGVRAHAESQSQNIMAVLVPFVETLQNEPSYRDYVTDVRNHFQFEVHSLRRRPDQNDERVEVFTGARRDAKSSAQTTQLAYALLASSLAYRFKFHDPIGGQETPRILVLDEFGGKFDNEKPREIVKLLDKMGFQSILVSPMSKADLLAEGVSQLVFVHKSSATHSKVQSFEISSKRDYDRLIQEMTKGASKPNTRTGAGSNDASA